MDNINVLFWNLKDESTIMMANRTLANFFGREEQFYNMKNISSNYFTSRRLSLFCG